MKTKITEKKRLDLIKCLDDVIKSSERMIEIQEKLIKNYDILISIKKRESQNLT